MPYPRFQYSGTWEDPADFPTHEYSEAQVRADLMRYHTEIETYLNQTLLPLLEASGYVAPGDDAPTGGGPYLPLAGGQLTGPLFLADEPTQQREAASKKYVDDAGRLIQEGVDGAISAITVELGRIQTTVADGLGNVTQIDITPGRIETLLQDELGRLLELLFSAEAIKAHFSDPLTGGESGMEWTANDFRQWWENEGKGTITEILASDEGVQTIVRDTKEGLETNVSITKDGLTSTAEDLFNQVKSLLEQNPGKVAAAVEGALGTTQLTLTQEQINAIARGVNGELGQFTVAPDQIRQSVTDGLDKEAVLELIEDRISQIVRNESSQAQIDVSADEIRQQVIDRLNADNSADFQILLNKITGSVRTALGQSSVEMTDRNLRALVIGTDHNDISMQELTADGIAGIVQDHTGAISSLNQTAQSIEARVTGAEGRVTVVEATASGLSSRVTDAETHVAQITQTAQSINTRVGTAESNLDTLSGQYTDLYQTINGITLTAARNGSKAQITLSIPGHTPATGEVAIDGNVNVSGEMSVGALYAQRGEVANLSVDQLDTSRRITKYLRQDTSDDNFIRIYRRAGAGGDTYGVPIIEFVTGTTSGTTTQARTPDGNLLYWDAENMDGQTVGTDGYPIVNGARVFTTTTQTNFPVYVYQYSETVKLSLKFDTVGDIYTPIVTFGAGNQQGTNKGWIVKSADGFDFRYLANNNKEVGLRMTTDGFVDITGLRRTTGLNFSGWDSGAFQETIEGRSAPIGYAVTFDANQRPTAISSGAYTLNIQW